MNDLSGVLHVMATPLGNLGDLSHRASALLASADVIYAEDTRRTAKLLQHLEARTAQRSLHEHNEEARCAEVCAALAAGQCVVLVSDAGCPGVSDPGARLVAAVVAAGYLVLPVPGPSALTTAVSVAGFVADEAAGCSRGEISFLGFVPARPAGKRKAWLGRVEQLFGVVVFFESPERLPRTLADLAAQQPQRQACFCREMTKRYESYVRAPLAELAAQVSEPVRGECTVVLAPIAQPSVVVEDAHVDTALQRCLKAGLSARDAARAVAAVYELPKRAVYERLQK